MKGTQSSHHPQLPRRSRAAPPGPPVWRRKDGEQAGGWLREGGMGRAERGLQQERAYTGTQGAVRSG